MILFPGLCQVSVFIVFVSFMYLRSLSKNRILIHHVSRSWDTNGGRPPWSVSPPTTLDK